VIDQGLARTWPQAQVNPEAIEQDAMIMGDVKEVLRFTDAPT
jgi:hypothetical protein